MDSVFLDESGYTGADLLNADQTVQVVAAVRISLERARHIVDEHFGDTKAAELKLTSLIRRPKRRAALVRAIQTLTDDLGAVGYVVCKRYMLWLRLLDDCLEPFCHARGIPFYENGWNRSFASVLFLTTDALWGSECTQTLLHAYQAASRSKSDVDIAAFVAAFQTLRGRDYEEFFRHAMNGDPGMIEEIKSPNTTLDISYLMVNGIISWLEERTDGPYEVVHDNNKAIKASLEQFADLAAIEETAKFKVSTVTGASFPLKFAGTRLADSKDDLRIQLADLFAGTLRLCTEMLRGVKRNDGLADELLPTLPHESLIFQLPTDDFAQMRATFGGEGGGKLVDFVATHLAKRKGKK